MTRAFDRWITSVWYGDSRAIWVLLPFSWLYRVVVSSRRLLYRRGLLKSAKPAVPVIIVGNITVGGTGKTPVTIWLAERLRAEGFRPGIISRGYRGNVGVKPVVATADSDPAVVGDEAVLLAQRSECIIVVHPDRVAAARLAAMQGADVLVSDDGLQHYALARDFEIVVVDGTRGFGNFRLLPAGPLREPVSRLQSADAVLVHRHSGPGETSVMRRSSDRKALHFELVAKSVRRADGSEIHDIGDFAGKRLHAVAAIGNPARFFDFLEQHGIEIIRHPLPDHGEISHAHLNYADDLDVIMTEKDAAKCRWLDTSKCWVVPVDVAFDDQEDDKLLDSILYRFSGSDDVEKS